MAGFINGEMPGRNVSSLRSDGFTDEIIERLMATRARYEGGAYSEETHESKRLLFVKWLFEHGKIREDEE